MSLNIETNETRAMKYPTHEVAPYIETGTKLPYNLKIVKGQVLIPNATAKRLTDVSTGAIVTLPRNCVVIAGAIVQTSSLTSASGCTFEVALSVTVPPATPVVMTKSIASAIPLANVVAGCAFKYGIVAAADQSSCIGPSVDSSGDYWPAVQTTGGTAPTAGAVLVTLVVMEMLP